MVRNFLVMSGVTNARAYTYIVSKLWQGNKALRYVFKHRGTHAGTWDVFTDPLSKCIVQPTTVLGNDSSPYIKMSSNLLVM